MYLDWVEERAAVLALLLALVAVVVAGTKDDLIYGLDLVSVGFVVGWPAHSCLKWWHRKEHPEWKGQFAVQVGGLLLGLGYTVGLYVSSFHKSADAYAVTGAMVGVLGLLWLTFIHIPAAAKRVKECPECVGRVDAKARVCRHCGHRWEPPLESGGDAQSG
jgi:hypothetical protein